MPAITSGALALAGVQGKDATAGSGKSEVGEEDMQAIAELNVDKLKQRSGNIDGEGRRQRSRSPKNQK